MNTVIHQEPEAPSASPLAGLLTLGQVPDKYPQVFPSVESVRWYLREHREGLEDAGALLVIRGRLNIVPGPFESYVLRAGQAAAKRRSSVAADLQTRVRERAQAPGKALL